MLLNTKSKIINWAEQNNVEFIQDKTNFESNFARNYIRNKMMNDVYYINPGIQKQLKRKLYQNIIIIKEVLEKTRVFSLILWR